MSKEKSDKKYINFRKELEIYKKERDEYLEGWQRARAELLNYKKDEKDRITDLAQRSNREMILGLLDILDNLDRFIVEAKKEKEQLLHQGAVEVRKKLFALMDRWGVAQIETTNQEFDPEKHEAVEVVVQEGNEEGYIIEEVLPGYLLHQKLLRPAKVKVAGKNKN